MTDHPAHRLKKLADKLMDLSRDLTRSAIARDYAQMALDVSAIATAASDVKTISDEITSGENAAVAAAVAAAQESDQAALDAALKPLQDEIAALKAQLAPPAPPAPMSVSPASVSFTAGTAGTDALTFANDKAPLSATGLPAGVTFDGANLVADGSQVAGTSSVTITDSSSPAQTVTVTVTVS